MQLLRVKLFSPQQPSLCTSQWVTISERVRERMSQQLISIHLSLSEDEGSIGLPSPKDHAQNCLPIHMQGMRSHQGSTISALALKIKRSHIICKITQNPQKKPKQHQTPPHTHTHKKRTFDNWLKLFLSSSQIDRIIHSIGKMKSSNTVDIFFNP